MRILHTHTTGALVTIDTHHSRHHIHLHLHICKYKIISFLVMVVSIKWDVRHAAQAHTDHGCNQSVLIAVQNSICLLYLDIIVYIIVYSRNKSMGVDACVCVCDQTHSSIDLAN